MSCSYTAFAGIGIVIRAGEIDFGTVEKPSCKHPERLGLKFCPECGKKVETKDKPAVKPKAFLETLEGLTSLSTSDLYEGEEQTGFFIGYYESMRSDNGEYEVIPISEVPTLDELKVTIHADLTKAIAKMNLPEDTIEQIFDPETDVGFVVGLHVSC
jgi:ribosomal protein L33